MTIENNFDQPIDPEVHQGIGDRIRHLGHIAAEDVRNAHFYTKATMVGLIAMTTYEWGPGNETVTPILGGRALEVSDGIGGVAISAGITGGFTLFQQLSSSWLSRKSVKGVPRASDYMYDIINNKDEGEVRFKLFDELSLAKKATYSIAIGSSFNVLREANVVKDVSEEQLKRVGRKSSIITASAVASMVTIADIVDQITPDNSIPQAVINFFKTPWPWLAIIGGSLSKDYFVNKFRRSKAKTDG